MARNGSDGRLSFVIVESDSGARGIIKKHLMASGHHVMGESEDTRSGLALVRGVHPDVLILELADTARTLERVEALREELPAIAVIVVSKDSSPQLILSCMRAGAHEFLTCPVDVVELDRAIDRLRKTLLQMNGSGRARGRVFSVFPAKGGAGGSSLATNLALSLLSEERSVALVDFNLQVGDLSLMLDMTPLHTFASAVTDEDFDENKLRTMMSLHDSGLNLLTISDKPEESDAVQGDHVPELLGHLTRMYDYVVVDLGRHIDDRSLQLFDLSDAILMVCTQDVPGIRNARRYADLLGRLEVARDRIHLIVNRHQQKGRVSNRDVESSVGISVFWSLPNDFRPMSAAIDSGIPIVLDSPKSKLSGSFHEFAALMAERYPAGTNGQLARASSENS